MKKQIPYEFGFPNQPLKLFDPKEKNRKRLEKLLKLEQSDLIIKICRHYINHFIPDPINNEDEYWIMSCFPSTDNSPVRVSIWFPEVFNISSAQQYFGYGNALQCMVFVHTDYLDKGIMRDLESKLKGLHFRPGYRFVTGIDKQLAAFMPLGDYFAFVEDECIYEAIRAHNYELTLKGRTPFKKGHNFEFVRYLLKH